LFRQVEESAHAERRARGQLTYEAWARLLNEEPDLGFVSRPDGIGQSRQVWYREMEIALHSAETTASADDARRLAVPLWVGGQVVGLLDGTKRTDKGPWTPVEIATMEALASQLSSAVERARLYRNTQRVAAREQLALRIAEQVRGALDVEEILRATSLSLGRELNASEVVVRLGTARELLGDADPGADRDTPQA
jgi:hypothetical protein